MSDLLNSLPGVVKEDKPVAIAKQNDISIFDETDSFVDMTNAHIVDMPIRRSLADIKAEEGVDELTAYEIQAEEEKDYNDALTALHQKSTARKEAKRQAEQAKADALSALKAQRASSRIIWFRVTITSTVLVALSVIAYIVVGVI